MVIKMLLISRSQQGEDTVNFGIGNKLESVGAP